MIEPTHAWLAIEKITKDKETSLELTLTVGSFKDPLIISIDAESWSRMLSNPTEPFQAKIRFQPMI